MSPNRRDLFLRVAAVSALLALAMMVWALLDSSPFAMIVSMSAGQGLGTISLLGWSIVAMSDLRKALRDRRWSTPPPPKPPSEPPP